MCQICVLALRHQRRNKSDSPLPNTKPRSIIINLNQQSDKLGKLSASNNQPLERSNGT